MNGLTVMMATGTVHMAVVDFFGAGVADFCHFYIEVECHPGHRVIAIEDDLIANHLDDRHELHAFSRFGMKLHARFDLIHALKCISWHGLHQVIVTQAIGLFRRNRDMELVAEHLPGERVFQAWNDVALAVDIGEGFVVLGTVENFALLVGEGVMKVHHFTSCDLH